MTNWNCKYIISKNELDNESILEQINNGGIPALVIRKFYTKKTCENIIKKISDYTTFHHGDTYLKKIGIFLSAYLNRKEQYFVDAKKSNERISEIFHGEENPIKKINQILCRISKLEKIIPASEKQQDYSRGIIRIWENEDVGPLHRDFANFESPNFGISRHQNQLSCVLYLQTPLKGGELLIHKQQWQKTDEQFREIGFGYTRNVLKEEVNAKIVPKQGDLIIFNPKFFHEILPTKGMSKRLTFGYFIGFSPSSNVAEFWS